MTEWLQSVAEWFWPRFDPTRCKLYLKSAVVRMNLKKKKGQEQNKMAEKEISELVKQEKDELARLKVEQLVREQRLLEAYDVLELFCEIVATRIQLIHMYPEIPDDLKEAVYTLTWASLRVAIPELKQLANQFKLKYGEEFLKEALDNTCCCVNEELMEKLAVCCPEKDFVEEEFFRLSPVPAATSQQEFASFAEGHDILNVPPPQQQQLPVLAPHMLSLEQQQQHQQQPFIPPSSFLPPSPSAPFPSSSSFSSPPSSASAPYIAQPYGHATGAPPPYAPPELDFGDWSSPITTTAFPHVPSPAAAAQALGQVPAVPPSLQSGAAEDVAMQFPTIPGDYRQDEPTPFVLPSPPADPGVEEFDELSARFEALRRGN